jgi:hypothetical protein
LIDWDCLSSNRDWKLLKLLRQEQNLFKKLIIKWSKKAFKLLSFFIWEWQWPYCGWSENIVFEDISN